MHKRGRDLVSILGFPKARKVNDKQEQPEHNHHAPVQKQSEPSEKRYLGQNCVLPDGIMVHDVPKNRSNSTAATRRMCDGGANLNTKGCRPNTMHIDHKQRHCENSAVQNQQKEVHRSRSEHRHAAAKLSTEHGDENTFAVASTDDYHHWANFLPSQHPADVPRLEYFSGGANSPGRGDEEGGDPVEQCVSMESHQVPRCTRLSGGMKISCGAPSSAANPAEQQGCSRSNTGGQRGGVQVNTTSADAPSMTEAHTPKLHHTNKDAQVSTLLTLAASTQSPHNAISDLADPDVGHSTAKDQDASPYSVDAATALDPPVLVPDHGSAKGLTGAANAAPCPCPITGESAHYAATSDQAGANTQTAVEPVRHTSDTAQASNAIPSSAVDLEDDEEDDDDEDDMLFSVDLSNLGAASKQGGAVGTIKNPSTSAAAASLCDNSVRTPAQAYGAAAEAVVPRSRLQNKAEEAVVNSITGWGQGEQGQTIRQQRDVDRHIVHQVELQGGFETVLIVQHTASGSLRFVHLRGGWMEAPIRPGDPMNVVVLNESQGWQQAPDGQLHIIVAQDGAVLLVLHPDALISSTSIAAALDCPRDAMLKERGYGGPSRAALMGTMMHDVVQSAIQALAAGEIHEPTAGPHRPAPVKRENRSDRSTSAIWRHMMGRIPEVVSENVVNLAEVGMTQREADRELRAAAGQLAATLSRTFRYTPSMPGSSSGAPEASIEGLMDIEESVWAPRYGLKGYIDATVLVRHLSIHQNGNTSSSNAGGKLGLAALEFKSGKQHHSHHAQLGTYGLLLQSRYGVEAAGGLLWYSRVENMEFTSKGPRDVAGLMMTRNKLAAYKAHDGAWNLPPPIQQDHRCRSCFSLPLCAAVHRTLEGGTAESFGLDVFTELTAHIQDKDAVFLKKWLELLEIEREEAKKKYPQENVWALDPPPCTRPAKQASPVKQSPSCVDVSAANASAAGPTVLLADDDAATAPENTSPNCPAKCSDKADANVMKQEDRGSHEGEPSNVRRCVPSQAVLRAAPSVSNVPLQPASAAAAPADVKHVLEGRCIGHLHLQSYLGKDDESPLYPFKYTFTQRQTPAGGSPIVAPSCCDGRPSVECLPLSYQGFTPGDCGILSLQGRHVAVNRAQVESVSCTVLTVRLRSRLAAGFEQSCTSQALDVVEAATNQGAGCCSKGSHTPQPGNSGSSSSTCVWRIDKDEPETAFQIAISGLLELVVSSSVHTDRLRSLLIHYEPPKQEAKVRYSTEAPADADHLEAMIESEKQLTLEHTTYFAHSAPYPGATSSSLSAPTMMNPALSHAPAWRGMSSAGGAAQQLPARSATAGPSNYPPSAFGNLGYGAYGQGGNMSADGRPMFNPRTHSAPSGPQLPMYASNSPYIQQPQHMSSAGLPTDGPHSGLHTTPSSHNNAMRPSAQSQQGLHQLNGASWSSNANNFQAQQHFEAQGYRPSQQATPFMQTSRPANLNSHTPHVSAGAVPQHGVMGARPSGNVMDAPAGRPMAGHLASSSSCSAPRPSAPASCFHAHAGRSATQIAKAPGIRSQSAPAEFRALLQEGSSQMLHNTSTFSQKVPSAGAQHPKGQALNANVSDKSGLTEEQQVVVDRVLDWNDYVLVMGLPGAGKTTTIAAIVERLVAEGRSVLVSAYTNSALDNVLLKVVSRGQSQLLRLGRTSSVHPDIKPYLPRVPAGNDPVAATALRKHVRDVPVVGVTCLSVARSPILRSRLFDVCILDEASQVTLPACLGPLLRSRTFVLVGDHLQLPPLVQSPKALEGGLGTSLFELLCKQRPEAQVVLRTQHRMCGPIMELNNEITYNSSLCAASKEVAEARLHLPSPLKITEESPQWLRAACSTEPTLVWLDTCNLPDAGDSKRLSGYCNHTEIALCKAVVGKMLELGVAGYNIGVTSPYAQQVAMMTRALCPASASSSDSQHEGNPQPSAQTLRDIEQKIVSNTGVMTIDRFQGQDKAVMIVSLVRSNSSKLTGDLLRDARRINVALTRAKHKVVIVGDSSTVTQVALLNKVLDAVCRLGVVIRLDLDAIQAFF